MFVVQSGHVFPHRDCLDPATQLIRHKWDSGAFDAHPDLKENIKNIVYRKSVLSLKTCNFEVMV